MKFFFCKKKSKSSSIAFFLISLSFSMFCFSYASVPLYRIFCKVTGYGGTIKRTDNISFVNNEIDKKIRIYFNADIVPDLPWEFYPEIDYIDVNVGKQNLMFYYAKNLSNNSMFGMAVYNVTPFKAGKYFYKVACFCFEEQMLLPGQKTLMPVSFYIDPKIINDINTKDLKEITLSYTFFKLK